MSKPVIDKRCKGTEKCLVEALEICPVNVFAKVNGKIIVKNPDECIGCRACESQCENGEIKMID